MPLVRHDGHIYLEWDELHQSTFSTMELKKLHRPFFHPSADKLQNLIKRARPEMAGEETRKILHEITATCHPCQMIARKPLAFTVGSANDSDITFNRELAMDIVYLSGRPAFHIIDVDTHFQAATFLKSMSTDDVWDSILRSWVNVYAGFPENVLTDQGSQLVSPGFTEHAIHFGVNFRYVPIESHNSNGLIKRYHEPLRRTYGKIKLDYPGITDELALSCTVHAANQTLGPEGLVPQTMVLGIIPRIGTKLLNKPTRVKALNTACEEMRSIMARSEINRALRRAVPPATDIIYMPGEEVLVFRERPPGFVGPYKIASIFGKTFNIHFPDGTIKPFSRSQVKHYHRQLEPESLASNILSHALNSTQEDILDTRVTAVIQYGDPRARDPRMVEAKRKEIRGLLARETFKIVSKREIPQVANVLKGRYVISIKDIGTLNETWKARFVIQGHRDIEKDIMVRSSTNVQHRSLRLLFVLCSMLGFQIWTQDAIQAYLQSSGILARDVFISNPQPELELTPEHALKPLKPLYGLADSGDFWYRELAHHHRIMGMHPLTIDSSLWLKFIDNVLQGLSAVYVDDVVQAGTPTFDRLTDSLGEVYDAKKKEYGDGRIAGIKFYCDEDGMRVNQS
jgi:Reverse transcriptase (RNA-dependent DNA polymerase)